MKCILFFIVSLIILSSCGEESKINSPLSDFDNILEGIYPDKFIYGDTIMIFGRNFNENSKAVINNNEYETIFVADTMIKLKYPDFEIANYISIKTDDKFHEFLYDSSLYEIHLLNEDYKFSSLNFYDTEQLIHRHNKVTTSINGVLYEESDLNLISESGGWKYFEWPVKEDGIYEVYKINNDTLDLKKRYNCYHK